MEAKRKATLLDGFGNYFGNKDVVLPPTIEMPIDLAEEVTQQSPKVSYWPDRDGQAPLNT